jgi:glycosyltransferase involved in cell wall biosynthesis
MREMFEPGGIASYIRRISTAQRALGHELLFFDRHPQRHQSPEPIEYTADDYDLMRRARDHKVDVLHLHCAVETTDPAIPTVRTVHTHAPYCPSQGRYLKKPGTPCNRNYSLLGCLWGHAVNRCGSVRPAALRRNFRTVHTEMRTLPQIRTIVVSDFLKQQMIRAGYPADRIDVLYLPAPTAALAADPPPPPRNEKPRFVFLGRMIPHNGVDWLLRAATQVQSDVHIDLAGTGNQEGDYRALASELGLTGPAGRVTFHGWLTPDTVQSLLHTSRALIFPSIWHEPGGTVAFEAMANARPVIMSRVGGMPEVVTDGQTGLIVPPGDVPALAQAIDRLATDYDLACRLGQAGRQRTIDHHSLDSHVHHLLALYAGAV